VSVDVEGDDKGPEGDDQDSENESLWPIFIPADELNSCNEMTRREEVQREPHDISQQKHLKLVNNLLMKLEVPEFLRSFQVDRTWQRL
jgi:hypothetical protein